MISSDNHARSNYSQLCSQLYSQFLIYFLQLYRIFFFINLFTLFIWMVLFAHLFNCMWTSTYDFSYLFYLLSLHALWKEEHKRIVKIIVFSTVQCNSGYCYMTFFSRTVALGKCIKKNFISPIKLILLLRSRQFSQNNFVIASLMLQNVIRKLKNSR